MSRTWTEANPPVAADAALPHREAAAIEPTTIELLAETVREAEALIAEQGWPRDEGLVTIFAAGLAYHRGDLTLRHIADGSADARTEAERLAQAVMELETVYAVLKRRAYYLAQDNQSMDLHEQAILTENAALQRRLHALQDEIAQLRHELARRPAESPQPLERPPAAAPWWRRWVH